MALVVSICEYNRFQGDNTVNFRVSLYFDSFVNEGFPAAYPVAADFVTFFLDKDTSGSELNVQKIRILDFDATGWGGGYSQGYGLDQSLQTSSDPTSRALWGLDAVAFGVGLFLEPVETALDLINIAAGWVPQPWSDYDNAETWENQALTWWHNPGCDFGTQNPVRQYAFNSIMWQQNEEINPSTYFGIKVSARVGLPWPNPFQVNYIDMPPVYLRIYHLSPPPDGDGDGGGGCPYVSVWNGSEFVLDNNLIPAAEHSNGTDVTDYYKLQQPLAWEEGKYSLRVWDLDKHSFLDQVRLLAVDHESDINIAVSPYGEILTYKNPAVAATAIDQNNQDVTSILSAVDANYFEGYAGDSILLDFGDLDVSSGAKLVLRTDVYCPIPPCKTPYSIHILNATGSWINVASVIPRIYWSTDIVDLSDYLPDGNGDVKLKLYFTAHHKIDFVGLDTTSQGEFETRCGNLAIANHTRLGDVKEAFRNSDNLHVELFPGEQVLVQFTLPQNCKDERDFIIILEGHYFFVD